MGVFQTLGNPQTDQEVSQVQRFSPFGAFRSALSYLTMILARFLRSSEFVWAVANTEKPFAGLTAQ